MPFVEYLFCAHTMPKVYMNYSIQSSQQAHEVSIDSSILLIRELRPSVVKYLDQNFMLLIGGEAST